MQRNGEACHVVVVGSGPAGMVLALELARLDCRVTLVESGGESAGEAQRLSEAEITSTDRHAPMADAVHRSFGGTSHLWGGRCVPLDASDFEPRQGVREAGWPFGVQALESSWAAACDYAECGPPSFTRTSDAPVVDGFEDGEVEGHRLERWSAWSRLVERLGPRIRGDSRITCALEETVVGFSVQPGAPGRIEALRLRPTGQQGAERLLSADVYVLACGGIESTRVLLNAHADSSLALDGHAHLGRYYMGHISGKIANVQFKGDPSRTISGFERSDGYYVRRRFTLAEPTLQREGLLNTAMWLDNPPPADPAHRSGILSAAYLALNIPVLRDRLAAPAIRKALLAGAGASRYVAHGVNLLRGPFKTAAFVAHFLHHRYRARPRLPGFFVHSPGNRYAIHYHAEQLPRADSRITLADDRDASGLRKARVDLRYSREDAESVVAAHRVFDEHIRRLGIGELIYHEAPEKRVDTVLRQARDGFHQIGTTRMAASPRDGVTDPQGRVFGTDNLYVCSSSLFPTSGQANPTLTLMAMAVRQARHLSERHVDRP